MAIASYKSPSQVISGDHEITGDRELKVAIASCKSRSRVISGDRE